MGGGPTSAKGAARKAEKTAQINSSSFFREAKMNNQEEFTTPTGSVGQTQWPTGSRPSKDGEIGKLRESNLQGRILKLQIFGHYIFVQKESNASSWDW